MPFIGAPNVGHAQADKAVGALAEGMGTRSRGPGWGIPSRSIPYPPDRLLG